MARARRAFPPLRKFSHRRIVQRHLDRQRHDAIAGSDDALRQPLRALAESYGSRFAFSGVEPLHGLLVLLVAAALGWLGAGVVTGHFLRQTKI